MPKQLESTWLHFLLGPPPDPSNSFGVYSVYVTTREIAKNRALTTHNYTVKKTDFRFNAFGFPGSNFMFYFPPRGQHIFYVIFPYSCISPRLFSSAAPHPLWYILRAQCLPPALPVDLRPLVWPIGAVLHFPIKTDHSLFSACPPSSTAMWQEPWQTDRQPGARSQALGPTASAAQPW